jgi:conjugative transfer signal peptidase TraF
MSRPATIAAMLAATLLIITPVLSDHAPRLVWNGSASAPVGLYRTAPVDAVQVGDLVMVSPPAAIAQLIEARGYLPRGVPLIKRILALPATEICRQVTTIFAYGRAYGEARERDAHGRDLPDWQGCRTLRADEVFLMNWDASDSLDGRYFGPLPKSAITAHLTPIWTDEDGDGRFNWTSPPIALEP